MVRGVEWAAGLFEGEGTITFTARGRVALALASTDKDIVDEFQRIVGGKVYGPYIPRTDNSKPYYQWHDTGEDNINEVLDMISPYLLTRRTSRVEECIALRNEFKNGIHDRQCKKLTLAERKELIDRASNGEKKADLAREYKVSPSSVSFYMKGL